MGITQAEDTTKPTTRGHRLRWSLLLERGRPTVVEFVIASIALLGLAVVVYAPHIVDGGFYYDDWANSAYSHYSGDGGYWDAVDFYADLTAYRPVLVLYVPLTHVLLGTHYGWHIAWAIALAILMSASLFQLLRTLAFERIHALLVAALVMMFPAADATRLWPTGSMATLAIALLLLGAVAALNAPRTDGWRSVALHGVSLALYLLSILTYELGAALILLAGFLYLWRGERREALIRWAVDIVGIGLTLALITTGHQQDPLGLDAMVDHARLVVDQGLAVIVSGAVPFGALPEAFVLGLLIGVAAVGTLIWRLLPGDDVARPELRRWLVIAGAGVLVAAAGWAVLIPADPYYSPLTLGVGNRVNAVAAMGIVLFVYAVVMLAATIAFRGLPRAPAFAAGLGVVGALVIGWGYGDRTRADITAWDAAFAQEQQVIDFLGAELPDPPEGSVVYLFGQPTFYAPGVPVFASTWDLNGMVKIFYKDPSLQGYPQTVGVACKADGVEPLAGAGLPAPYGSAIFADFATRRIVEVTSRRQCKALAGRLKPGPFQLTPG